MAYMAKKELFDVPVLSRLISALGAFPVNRKKLEIKTIKTAKRILSSKRWNLGIFPQGTRVMDGTLGDVKPGFGHLAKATKSTVIPVFIDMKRGRFPFYGKVIVKIGKPLPLSNNVDEIQENWKKAISELAGIEYKKPDLSKNSETAVL
jgi:1-acyl-sn-glycerol-3-phosphate acyltransferase